MPAVAGAKAGTRRRAEVHSVHPVHVVHEVTEAMGVRLSDSEAQLGRAMKDLSERWLLTAAEWRDNARTDFETEYLEELQQEVRGAQRAMIAVRELLLEIVHDCGDSGG